MASSNHEPERVFSAYTATQAKAYAAGRPSYSAPLYNTIFDHHSATGGSFNRVLDIGCGPGNATRKLAKAFDKAIGVDAGTEMINVARDLGGTTRTGELIEYDVRAAEKVDNLGLESVDLVTSAMAAHWFDMTKFWPAVAKLLKPNGTVALWHVYSLFCHPSTPNADAVQQAMFKLEYETLEQYALKGNRLVLGGYRELTMPWMLTPPESAFDKTSFRNLEWNKDGKVGLEEEYFGGQREMSLEDLEKGLATSSSITRWREANPQLAYTAKDCVKETMAEIRSILPEGVDKLVIGGNTVLLMFKKVNNV